MLKGLVKRSLKRYPVESTVDCDTAPLPPGRVCAVIVTFNRIGPFKECVAMVRNQSRAVDHILVVDNGSTDGTREWLANQPDIEVVTQDNLGNAGGQATGIARALASGFEWMWCMDDDVGPLPDALEIQLRASEGRRAVITKRFRSTNPEENGADIPPKQIFQVDLLCENTGRINYIDAPPGKVVTTNCGHFEGMLVPAAFVRHAGPPDPRFFLFGEDTIYGYLASRFEGCVLVTRPLFKKLIPAPKIEDYPSPSNLYFRFRNRILFWEYLRKNGTLRPGLALSFLFLDLLRHGRATLLHKNNKAKRLKFLYGALVDGLAGRFGAGRLFTVR
jgi:GT2 family glycosyltransferase